MPKEKENLSSFYRRVTKEYQNVFRSDQSVLFCLVCDIEIAAKQMSQVKQHVSTAKHLAGLKRKTTNENNTNQTLLTTLNDANRDVGQFAIDLTDCFLKANIPLYTIRNPDVVKFVEKYTKYASPSEFTLRNKILPKIYDKCVGKMKQIANGKHIWASIDESTDSEDRFVANFVFGIMGDERERDRCYLFASKVLTNVNSSTIATFFDECINELSELKLNRIELLIFSLKICFILQMLTKRMSFCP